ncbi:MAG TPA: hypothetical protein VF708_08895 [Pyrinomonadaceae bacterium]
MKARLRTLAVLLIMSVCLVGDFVITRQVQANELSSSQVVGRRPYRQRLARWRMLSHRRRAAARRLRQRRRITILTQRRRRSFYWRRNHPRAWSIWARRHRRGRINWRETHPRAWSIWARRHRNRGRGRNLTPGIPRGRARGWHRNRD